MITHVISAQHVAITSPHTSVAQGGCAPNVSPQGGGSENNAALWNAQPILLLPPCCFRNRACRTVRSTQGPELHGPIYRCCQCRSRPSLRACQGFRCVLVRVPSRSRGCGCIVAGWSVHRDIRAGRDAASTTGKIAVLRVVVQGRGAFWKGEAGFGSAALSVLESTARSGRLRYFVFSSG